MLLFKLQRVPGGETTVTCLYFYMGIQHNLTQNNNNRKFSNYKDVDESVENSVKYVINIDETPALRILDHLWICMYTCLQELQE